MGICPVVRGSSLTPTFPFPHVGPKENHKHAHCVTKIRFPTGAKGSTALIALKFHIRNFLRYTDKSQYVDVTPIDKSEQGFERSAGYCFKDRRMPGFAWKSHNMTQVPSRLALRLMFFHAGRCWGPEQPAQENESQQKAAWIASGC